MYKQEMQHSVGASVVAMRVFISVKLRGMTLLVIWVTRTFAKMFTSLLTSLRVIKLSWHKKYDTLKGQKFLFLHPNDLLLTGFPTGDQGTNLHIVFISRVLMFTHRFLSPMSIFVLIPFSGKFSLSND